MAKTLNVSRMTITTAYRAINETGAITRIKSKGTFIAPDASPDKLRALLSHEKPTTKKIGVILPSALSMHPLKILSGILESVKEYQIVVATTEMSQVNEQRHIREMLADKISGLILYPVDDDHYNNSLLNLAIENFPVVLVDRSLRGLDFGGVTSDSRDMIEKSLHLLLSHGNREILFFNANPIVPSSIGARRDSYIEFLQRNNVSVHHIYQYSADDPDGLEEDFRRYLDERPQITAIITADYTSSIRLFEIFQKWSVRIPGDFEVIYIDIDANYLYFPFGDLPTHIRQDSRRIGELAAELLLKRLKTPAAPRESLTVPAQLILGNSTKEPTSKI